MRRIILPRWDRQGVVLAFACVAVATLCFVCWRRDFEKGQWALCYLLLVTLVSNMAGVRAGLTAALLSFLAWDFFFLPPYASLFVRDPKDWLSLLVYLLVAIAMGIQTGRMREREAEALARDRESSLLNRLSASLVAIASTRTIAETVLSEIQTITAARDVALWLIDADGRLGAPYTRPTAPGQLGVQAEQFARWVSQQNKAVGLPPIAALTKLGEAGWPISVSHQTVMPGTECQDLYLPLATASRIEGVLAVGARTDGQQYTAHDVRLLVSITMLVAGSLERQHLEAAAGRVEAYREAELLKGTLISSVSHELKTPLSALTATITSLLENDVEWDAETVRRELADTGQNLARLNDNIGALLDLSRLKADAWKPQKDWYEVGEILGTVMSTQPVTARERIHFTIPDELPPILVDFQQLSRVVHHLLENALVYAPVGTTIRVGAASTPREVRLSVEDEGPGIAVEERGRIFEQFYRGASSSLAPSGTGLGLTISSEIIRYHGGRIWVEEVRPHGARFIIALPREVT